MVTRTTDSRRLLEARLRGAFAWWRRAVDVSVGAVMRAAAKSPPLAVGLTALLVGTVGTMLVSPPLADGAAGVRSAAALLLWAGIRLFVLIWVARNTFRTPRSHLLHGWGWSLAPFAVAVNAPLHAAAFAVSAGIAWFALERFGASRREAITLVAWAYGFQLAAVIAIWLARSAVLGASIILAP